MKIFSWFFFTCFLGLNALFGAEGTEQTVILGSGPAGLTAAIYTARAGLAPLLIEGDEPGGQIALSYTVENYPGFPEGIGGDELVEKMRAQAKRFGTRFEHGKVISANLTSRPFRLTLEGGKKISSETLIIATGASVRWLGLDSERALIGKGVGSCAICDGALYKDKEVVVVGGGDSAFEDAIYLSQYAKKVSLIHRRDVFKASKVLQNRAKELSNIHTILNSTVEEIKDPKNGQVTGVVIRNIKNNVKQFYPCHGVFIAIGHIPNNVLFQGQLKTTPNGYLISKPPTTETDIPGVFVAGDIGDPKYRQAITAAGEGAKAGIDATHYIQEIDKTNASVEKENLTTVIQPPSSTTQSRELSRNSTGQVLMKRCTNALADQEILEINSLNFKEVISQSKQVIIDVYSNRCVYCKRLEPIFHELSNELGSEYIFAKLCLDSEPALVDSFNVRGFPTVIFLKGGQEVGRHVGYMTKEAFRSEIQNFFSSK